MQKWGGQEGLDKERQRRLVKRLERAQAKAGKSISSKYICASSVGIALYV